MSRQNVLKDRKVQYKQMVKCVLSADKSLQENLWKRPKGIRAAFANLDCRPTSLISGLLDLAD